MCGAQKVSRGIRDTNNNQTNMIISCLFFHILNTTNKVFLSAPKRPCDSTTYFTLKDSLQNNNFFDDFQKQNGKKNFLEKIYKKI